MWYVFELVVNWWKYVISVMKFNGIVYFMLFWDDIFKEVSWDYVGIKIDLQYIDVLVVFFVIYLECFDVIVVLNLFGDVLIDIGVVIMGSVGIVFVVNINVNGKYFFMFEFVYGFVLDIVGKGIVNFIG